MKTLYIECNMGAAGDMLMSALLELHPNAEEFLNRLNKLGIPPNHQVVGCAAIGYVNQEGATKEKKESRIHIVR